MDLEQGLDLSDLTRMLRRRIWLVLGIAGACTLVAIFIGAILRNVYQASATLLVEPQTISERLVQAGLPQQDINSRLHLIQMQILSRGRLSRVIDDLNLYETESKELTREAIIERMRNHINLRPVLPQLEEDLGNIKRQVDINTFILSFRHHHPRTAADVANRLANDFIEEHIKERVEISGDTSEFVEAELNRLSQRIADIEERIAAVKSENAGSLPEDMSSNQRQLERTLEAMRFAQRDLTVAESDAGFYAQQAAAAGLGTGADTSPARRLETLEIELNTARSRGFSDKHPDIRQLSDEIQALKARIAAEAEAAASDGEAPAGASEGEQVAEAEESPSPAQQSARAEARRAELRAEAARQEIARLQAQAQDVEARIGATPRVAERLNALTREHEHLFKSYQDFANRRLEASVAADMERRQKGEQFRVLEAAYPNPDPISPNRTLIFVMGLLLGLILGGGLAVVLEFSDSSYHTPRRLQDTLRIPVLASVPSVILASDRIRQRRRRTRVAVAAVAFTGLMLTASIVGHWTVNGVPGVVRDLIEGDSDEGAAGGQG